MNFIERFLKLESSSGILLIATSVLAIIIANSPLSGFYDLLLKIPVEIRVANLEIAKPLLLWINDGLMAIFFLLIGLELKRELLEGELSEVRKIILPALGALGGMVIPAAFYLYLNYSDPVAVKGWAIPAATDIAFALAILTLLGSRVPVSLKIFLTSLAIIDDIGAILIIALFYTTHISSLSIMIALLCIITLYIVNRMGVMERSIYLAIGLIMWIALLKSGVHATLAGVMLAMFIPLKSQKNKHHSPLRDLEDDLHTSVAFIILPLFAFTNAGVDLRGTSLEYIFHNVPLGIICGLFLGKQIGIFSLCWIGVKLKLAELPPGLTWIQLYGCSLLCGIGFTMSLFIGSLAFEETGVNLLFDERIGIITGSLLSGIAGYLVLYYSLNKKQSL